MGSGRVRNEEPELCEERSQREEKDYALRNIESIGSQKHLQDISSEQPGLSQVRSSQISPLSR